MSRDHVISRQLQPLSPGQRVPKSLLLLDPTATQKGTSVPRFHVKHLETRHSAQAKVPATAPLTAGCFCTAVGAQSRWPSPVPIWTRLPRDAPVLISGGSVRSVGSLSKRAPSSGTTAITRQHACATLLASAIQSLALSHTVARCPQECLCMAQQHCNAAARNATPHCTGVKCLQGQRGGRCGRLLVRDGPCLK